MAIRSIEDLVKEVNTLDPCVGSYECDGSDGKNRLTLIKEVREIFYDRAKKFGLKRNFLFCYRGRSGILLSDYVLPNKDYSKVYRAKIEKGKQNRLLLPKKIRIKKGGIIFVGKGSHFEIHYKKP